MDNVELWVAGGGPGVSTVYGYGYWTGPDNDLLCVFPDVKSVWMAEMLLSPLSRIKLLAYAKFVVKRWLFLDYRGRT